jgi:uroporphyrinogen-III decarboxylase
MTSKERFLAALCNDVPDLVPVAPDISTYIPMKRSGLPFWEICFNGVIPHWQLYMQAADYYGLDAWVAPVMGIPFLYDSTRTQSQVELEYDRQQDAMLRRSKLRTPDGDLCDRAICFRGEPPFVTDKLIKDLAADFKKFKWTRPMPTGVDRRQLAQLQQACAAGDHAFGVTITYPGLQNWNSFVQGGIEALAYAEVDTPALLEEWFEFDLERGTQEMELALDSGVDYILFGGSGTITLASPELARKYALPALSRFSRLAKEAGVPTMLHSCGKSRILAELLDTDTHIGMLNPLEPPPMGDVDLAELKRAHGHRFALMGNLHTTEVMLHGSPGRVRQQALEVMQVAGCGGGFTLSTGDQCGRETPEENIFAMVEAARKYGRYDPATGTLPDLPTAT